MNNKKAWLYGIGAIFGIVIILLVVRFFSEESQNKFMRGIQATYGFKHGQVEVLAGQPTPVMRWLGVEKLTTATASQGSAGRSYRYGFGYFDENLNSKIDANEKQLGKKYFEIGPYTMYVYRDAGQ